MASVVVLLGPTPQQILLVNQLICQLVLLGWPMRPAIPFVYIGQAKWSTGLLAKQQAAIYLMHAYKVALFSVYAGALRGLLGRPSRRPCRATGLVANSVANPVISYVVASPAMLRTMMNPPATLESISATSELTSSSTSSQPVSQPTT
jgi:hypothetical protein